MDRFVEGIGKNIVSQSGCFVVYFGGFAYDWKTVIGIYSIQKVLSVRMTDHLEEIYVKIAQDKQWSPVYKSTLSCTEESHKDC